MSKITILFALHLLRPIIAALPWIYTNSQLDAHLRTCLSNDYYKYNITHDLTTNMTTIQPFEHRSTYPEGQDSILMGCLQISFPYHVVGFIPNQEFARDTGMYDDSEDSEDSEHEIEPTQESRNAIPYVFEPLDPSHRDHARFDYFPMKDVYKDH